LNRYAALFSCVYAVSMAAIAVVAFRLQLGPGAAGLFVLATALATFTAAWKFAKDKRRVPRPKEAAVFAWAGLAAVWLLSLAVAVAVCWARFGSSWLQGLNLWPFVGREVIGVVGGLVVLSALCFVSIRSGFNSFATSAMQRTAAA